MHVYGVQSRTNKLSKGKDLSWKYILSVIITIWNKITISVSTEKRPQNYKQVGHYGVQIKVNLIKDVTSDPAARNKRFTQFTQFYRGQLSKTTYQIFKV